MPNTLLLNAGFEPLRIVSWQRAFALIFQEKVEILEEYGFIVATVSRHYNIPAVIRLNRWVNLKRTSPIIRFSRANLYARDNYRCQYCHKYFPERELTLDHVLPVVRGGKKTWDNILTACIRCNQRKGHRTPEEAGLKPLNRPVAPRWLPGMVGSMRMRSAPEIWARYLRLYSDDPFPPLRAADHEA
ncbi:MAG: HNH endonuclease [Deltaproteobacteria bacterium]|nr:HNH endonuclease [Deltaproteobacteria bacterium]MBI3296058.1 HNH endonuclease [Deltaproteobacteria bacterium]